MIPSPRSHGAILGLDAETIGKAAAVTSVNDGENAAKLPWKSGQGLTTLVRGQSSPASKKSREFLTRV